MLPVDVEDALKHEPLESDEEANKSKVVMSRQGGVVKVDEMFQNQFKTLSPGRITSATNINQQGKRSKPNQFHGRKLSAQVKSATLRANLLKHDGSSELSSKPSHPWFIRKDSPNV